jgi:hypothetical protein
MQLAYFYCAAARLVWLRGGAEQGKKGEQKRKPDGTTSMSSGRYAYRAFAKEFEVQTGVLQACVLAWGHTGKK